MLLHLHVWKAEYNNNYARLPTNKNSTWWALAGCNWAILWPVRRWWIRIYISKVWRACWLIIRNRVHCKVWWVLWACTKVAWVSVIILANKLMHDLHDVIIWFSSVSRWMRGSCALKMHRTSGNQDRNSTTCRWTWRWVCRRTMANGIRRRSIHRISLHRLMTHCIWYSRVLSMNTWSSRRWARCLMDWINRSCWQSRRGSCKWSKLCMWNFLATWNANICKKIMT